MDRYFIINDFQSFDKYLHLFDRKTFEYITSLVNKGQGPKLKMVMNEAIFPDYIQFIDDSMAIGCMIQPIGDSNFQPAVGKLNIHTGQITLMPYIHPKIPGWKRVSVVASVKRQSITVGQYFAAIRFTPPIWAVHAL
ncbi:MAG: hypothetical protein LBB84_00495, partial [Tannerellaceae bacterium]|nr:hypothetical protein [Tannerellaceae bacterium]